MKFVPTAVTRGEYEGDVEVEFLDTEVRWQAIEDVTDLTVKASVECPEQQVNQIRLARYLNKAAGPTIKRVALKRKADSVMLTSHDELARDPLCIGIIQEIAYYVIMGHMPAGMADEVAKGNA